MRVSNEYRELRSQSVTFYSYILVDISTYLEGKVLHVGNKPPRPGPATNNSQLLSRPAASSCNNTRLVKTFQKTFIKAIILHSKLTIVHSYCIVRQNIKALDRYL